MKPISWVTGALNTAVAVMSTAPPDQWLDGRVIGVGASTFLLSLLHNSISTREDASKEEIVASIRESLEDLVNDVHENRDALVQISETFEESLIEIVERFERCDRDISKMFADQAELSRRVEELEEFVRRNESLKPQVTPLIDFARSRLTPISYPSPYIRPCDPPALPSKRDFIGRRMELKQIDSAMKKDRRVIAVIGIAGQGKSSLLGNWFLNHCGPPEGVGLFACSPYQDRYTFDSFLAELLGYLTGRSIDRREFPRTEDLLVQVDGILVDNPCWIILDGAERWLNLWRGNPDIETGHPTVEDRKGAERCLDAFLGNVEHWAEGSRLFLTTRALPHALDDMKVAEIGSKDGLGRELVGLKPNDAAKLLRNLGVKKGSREELTEAAEAYNFHPFALGILGGSLARYHDGDIQLWQEVDPVRGDLNLLIGKALERCPADRELLDLIACAVGPAPLELLAEFLNETSDDLFERLERLDEWRYVDFSGKAVSLHSVMRARLLKDIDQAKRKETQVKMAHWWAAQPRPARPQKLADVESLLIAVDHALEAEDASISWEYLYSKPGSECPYRSLCIWLRMFGFSNHTIGILNNLISLYRNENVPFEDLGRRLNLAFLYDQRGHAYWRLKEYSKAAEEYDLEVRLLENLTVFRDDRRLIGDLARAHTNRANAIGNIGHLTSALEDYDRAIEARCLLVEGYGRKDQFDPLARIYNNKGSMLRTMGRIQEAIENLERAEELYRLYKAQDSQRKIRRSLAIVYGNRSSAFQSIGLLKDALKNSNEAVAIKTSLVEQEDRTELLSSLADSLSTRGSILTDMGDISRASYDLNKAVSILTDLLKRDDRTDLRSNVALALFYRGSFSLAIQDMSSAIHDLSSSIEMYRSLMRGCASLRSERHLAQALAKRAHALTLLDRLDQAGDDMEESSELLGARITQGQIHFLYIFIENITQWCQNIELLGRPEQAAAFANDALRWLREALDRGEKNDLLEKQIPGFLEALKENRETLAAAGLDGTLLDACL